MLGATQDPCKTTKVKDPYSDKAMRKAAGSKGTKTTAAGDMSMQYPTSLDIGGKGVWLPINLDSTAPSGYVQIELTQGPKDLAAIGGGTPAGESGPAVTAEIANVVKPNMTTTSGHLQRYSCPRGGRPADCSSCSVEGTNRGAHTTPLGRQPPPRHLAVLSR